jgi:hypothetical protein
VPVAVASEAWSEPSLTTSRSVLARAELPVAEPPAEPVRPRTPWLATGAFDDEAVVRSAPLPAAPEPTDAVPQYPIPPAVNEPDPTPPAAVPTWSFRAPSATPQPAIAPAFVGDFSFDPLSLRRRTTIRSGAFALTVDESRLVLRNWWQRNELAWTEILGFEARPVAGDAPRDGRLVALTKAGPVELPATKRPLAELRYLHALLDAYRRRAQLMAR